MKKLFCLAFALMLTACMPQYRTLYYGSGYTDVQLSQNTFKVTYKGTQNDDKDKVSQFLLLRNAQLALDNNYKYFKIVSAADETTFSTQTTPIVSKVTEKVTTDGTNNPPHADSAKDKPDANPNNAPKEFVRDVTTTLSGGDTYTVTEPRLSNTIICQTSKTNDAQLYDAQLIKKSVMTRYHITDKDLQWAPKYYN